MSPDMRSDLADTYMAAALWVSLHDGDPGDDGDNEAAGIDRQPLTWDQVLPGILHAEQVTFLVPPGTVLTHVGIWGSELGTDFKDSRANAITFDIAGNYLVTLTHTFN